MMRIFFTSSLIKFTSSLSDLSVDYIAVKQEIRQNSVQKSDVPVKVGSKNKGWTDLLNKSLQLVSELAEVAGGDESEAALL